MASPTDECIDDNGGKNQKSETVRYLCDTHNAVDAASSGLSANDFTQCKTANVSGTIGANQAAGLHLEECQGMDEVESDHDKIKKEKICLDDLAFDFKFTCDNCDKTFRTMIDFYKHRLLHTSAIGKSKRMFKTTHIAENIEIFAKTDPKDKTTLSDLLKNDVCDQGKERFELIVERSRKRYKCRNHCDKIFNKRRHLDKHVRDYIGHRPYFCIFCDKTFIAFEYLSRHNYDHLIGREKRPYKCTMCPKTFATKCGFKNHFILHSNPEKNFKCELCGKSFYKNCLLQSHMRTHQNQKNFKCELCPKRFNYKTNLKHHMREHNLEPMSCRFCDKKFHNKYYFAKHERGHVEKQSFSCDLCEKIYAHTHALRTHRNTHIVGRVEYSCDRCPKKFTDKYSYVYHREAHSPEKFYNCKKCERKFIRQFQLNHHLRYNIACRD